MAVNSEDKQALLVVGSGRSGTSLTAGLLGRAGWCVPAPEVPANASNPRGFAEPQWLVDFHEGLLERSGLDNQDPRPSAWEVADRVSAKRVHKSRLRAWLKRQLDTSNHLVLKDPRSGWFLPMHRDVATEIGMTLGVITVLRPPAQALSSRQLAYGEGVGEAALSAAWLNMTLRVEERTRDVPRAFVAYEDVMRDWRSSFEQASQALGLQVLVSHGDEAESNAFVDPQLRRASPSWEGLNVSRELARLCDSAYGILRSLVDDPQRNVAVDLERLRMAYDEYYEDCRAVAAFEVKRAADRAKRVPRLVKHQAERSWRGLAGRSLF